MSDRSAEPASGGRAAQRRRTRAAILEATTALITGGGTPSVDEIAAAADVSRRTVYLYFPTLDQLLLDATVGALSAGEVQTALCDDDDAPARVDSLVRDLVRTAESTLPLGRKIIRLTVDAPAADHPDAAEGAARRGYRRLEWVQAAVQPMRHRLTQEQYERLVAALTVVIGWESMVVLRDVDGLGPRREEEVLRWMAESLVRGMLAEADDAVGG
nr:TetR/AcrR family transcriptional regulator [Allobranchiibius sp. GilTou38]